MGQQNDKPAEGGNDEQLTAEEIEQKRLKDEEDELQRKIDAGEVDPETHLPIDPPAEVDEVVVSIDGEEPPPSEEDDSKAPQWVKDLRESKREDARRIRELEAELKASKGATQKPSAIVVGEKPTIEGCDYDTDKFALEFEAWQERKRAAEKQVEEQSNAEKQQQAEWDSKLTSYNTEKEALKKQLKGVDETEALVKDVLSITQQGIILQAVKPALLVQGLGKNPKRLKELAAIKDPVRFAIEIGATMTKMKVQTRKAPAPEKIPTGGAPGGGTVDSELVRLRAEAQKTGDFTKVSAYRRNQRAKAAARTKT